MDGMKYEMVVVPEYRREEVVVTSKTFMRNVNRGGHNVTVYMLKGIRDNGRKATAYVSKDKWDLYDVPVEEIVRRSKKEILKEHKDGLLLKEYGRTIKKAKVQKSKRKADNSDIEKWLLEHNGMDFDSLVNQKIIDI